MTLGPESASGHWWKEAIISLAAGREAKVGVTGLSWSLAVRGACLGGGGATLHAVKQPVRPTVNLL